MPQKLAVLRWCLSAPGQMYQPVNDVKSYPDFLPGRTGSRVLGIGADANDGGG